MSTGVRIRDLFNDPVLIPSNMLSILRAVLAPVMVWLMMLESRTGDGFYMYLTVACFIIIIILDFLDGFLARLLNQVTRLGQFLDPLADKVIILSLSVGLAFFKGFPVWVAVFLWVREISIFVAGFMIFSRRNVEVKPNFLGKLSVFTASVTAFVFICEYDGIIFGLAVKDIMVYLMILFYIVAAIQYVRTYFHDKPAEN